MLPLKILGLSGSIREGSHTTKATLHALGRAKSFGAEVEFLDLRKLHLPFCDGSDDYPEYPDVAVLRQACLNADALLIATPEYHGSVSGVLKNVLDLLRGPEIKGKVAALMAVSGGIHSTNALNTLRIILRQLHVWTIHEQLILGYSDVTFSGESFPKEDEERLSFLLHSLISTTKKLK